MEKEKRKAEKEAARLFKLNEENKVEGVDGSILNEKKRIVCSDDENDDDMNDKPQLEEDRSIVDEDDMVIEKSEEISADKSKILIPSKAITIMDFKDETHEQTADIPIQSDQVSLLLNF